MFTELRDDSITFMVEHLDSARIFLLKLQLRSRRMHLRMR